MGLDRRDSATKPIVRWSAASGPETSIDELASEEPLEIRVNGQAVSVTMRTPGSDAELAVGFLLSEGIIRTDRDVVAVRHERDEPTCNVIDVTLDPTVAIDFAALTRHVFASSSCGLCGKATIAAVHRHFAPVDAVFVLAAEQLLELPNRLRSAQAVFERTGGLHASAVFRADGELVVTREDVGRHNAVDKIIGYALLERALPFDRHVLLLSGRASFEILQKALAARIAVIAAVSAPSTLAVDFAAASGQTLIGFLRGRTMNVYSHAERIRF